LTNPNSTASSAVSSSAMFRCVFLCIRVHSNSSLLHVYPLWTCRIAVSSFCLVYRGCPSPSSHACRLRAQLGQVCSSVQDLPYIMRVLWAHCSRTPWLARWHIRTYNLNVHWHVFVVRSNTAAVATTGHCVLLAK
jgi:hypothetical protein